MIASLGMYAMPHARAAHDRLWNGIRDAFGDGPVDLDTTDDMWGHWLSPDLLLSQTCGLPFRARLHDQVALIGTPDYGLPGCPPGHYNSVFLVHVDNPATTLTDLNNPILAYNEALSQSGWAAPHAHFQRHRIAFEVGPQTGAHAASARVVAEGGADIAALDALTWAMLQRETPLIGAPLKEIGRTDPTPGLPYVTAATRDPAPVAAAIDQAIARLDADDREILHLKGLIRIPASAYLALPIPPHPDQYRAV
jgi:ABC-type phosphate/phosphonate transport system substrate-binding protein